MNPGVSPYAWFQQNLPSPKSGARLETPSYIASCYRWGQQSVASLIGLFAPKHSVSKIEGTYFDLAMDESSIALRKQIEGIMLSLASGPPQNYFPGKSNYSFIREGFLHYPRLQALHRLLSEGRPKNIQVTENGSGLLNDLAYTIATLGSRVTVIEPNKATIPHRLTADNITYAMLDDSIVPVEIAYWPNPLRLLGIPSGMNLIDYMGRHSRRYLVIQSDTTYDKIIALDPQSHPEEMFISSLLRFDPRIWKLVYSNLAPSDELSSGFVLPTAQAGPQWLGIFQRRDKPA
ncbi:MAG: hypothetical protein HY540_00255 [Deltaproteobacteria bacterium]|nr:hypothetical protein [Deltaproteobacteria bacterium]